MTTSAERISSNLTYHPDVHYPKFPHFAVINVAGVLAGYETAPDQPDWKVQVTDHHSCLWTDSSGTTYRVTVTPV